MTNSVELNGNIYTDDSNASTGMGNGGHRTRFIRALSDFLVEAAAKIQSCVDQVALALGYKNDASTSATAAAASAASAVNSPGTSATSTTSLSVGTGSKTFTIQTGKSFALGQKVTIAQTSNPSGVSMYGSITAYNSSTGSMTVNVVSPITGTGTYSDWTIALSGGQGLSLVAWQRKTSNYTAVAGERIAAGTGSGAKNKLTYSEQFDNAAWIKTNATISANAATAPDGTLSMDKLVEDTSNGVHRLSRSNVMSVGTTYTATIFAEAGERSKAYIAGSNIASNGGGAVVFNLSNGTIYSNGVTLGSATISDAGGGIYRCSVTFSGTAVAAQSLLYGIANSSGATTYTGDGTSGLYLWGAQLEAASSATSYVKTEADGNLGWTLTLPASPAANDFVDVMDDDGAFQTNNLTVARNGQTIMGLSEDMTVSTNNISFGLRFNGTTWRVY